MSARTAALSKQGAKQEAKTETSSKTVSRSIGLSFSAFFYAASGLYYLIYPFVVQDTSMWFLYLLGAGSIVGAIGIIRMTRWGLWFGLGLFPFQVAATAYALMAAFNIPGVTTTTSALIFIVSLAILLFFACLTFLLVLDKRRTFKKSFRQI